VKGGGEIGVRESQIGNKKASKTWEVQPFVSLHLACV
jgi:hypothetical protein